MALAVRRHMSTTRMDVLSVVIERPSIDSDSPTDSLSPLGNFSNNVGKYEVSSVQGSRNAQTQQQANTFPAHGTKDEPAKFQESTTACSPRCRQTSLITRPRRPTDLKLYRSNGLTTLTSEQLKQRICDGHTASARPRTHVPRPKQARRSKSTPALMGNKPSSLQGSPEPRENDVSLYSPNRRKPMRVLRKSSTNLFKRMDSKSPLPRPLTATSILVHSGVYGDVDSPIDPFHDPAHSARDSILMLPSTSTLTVTDDVSGQPLSASTTIKSPVRNESRSPYQSAVEEVEDEDDLALPVPAHRDSALSPTIPAPSPLPEDSPHKYGLKDHVDTPERAQEPAEEFIEPKAARRISSGVELFNEVKSLQSASSFLNGLSTSRRRAESMNRTDTTWNTTLTGTTSRPASRPGSRPATARPPSAARLTNGITTNESRRKGHNFKSNGFAFSRTLEITQLRCYRNHERLLVSKNKHAPIECAVCHVDDDHEHWTCSWCAIRMCRFCRKDFAERGIIALRERVRKTEMPPSPSGSTEGLGRPRGGLI